MGIPGSLRQQSPAPESPTRIFLETDALLESLGYELAWLIDGNSAITIKNYPGRPVVDNFQLVYITPPVGNANPAVAERPAYYNLKAPAGSACGPFEGSDIRPALRARTREVQALIEAHSLAGDVPTVNALLHVLGGDVGRVSQCLERKIHPKWIADVMSFGLDYEEAIQLKGIPYQTLYELYAD